MLGYFFVYWPENKSSYGFNSNMEMYRSWCIRVVFWSNLSETSKKERDSEIKRERERDTYTQQYKTATFKDIFMDFWSFIVCIQIIGGVQRTRDSSSHRIVCKNNCVHWSVFTEFVCVFFCCIPVKEKSCKMIRLGEKKIKIDRERERERERETTREFTYIKKSLSFCGFDVTWVRR